MPRRVLLLTGELAEPRLRRVLASMGALDFEAQVVNLGVKVAALLTTELVLRRLPSTDGADLVLLPGRFRGDLDRLSEQYGTRFVRGPDELDELPAFFKREAAPIDLSRYETWIFAEVVDAPRLDVAGILRKAEGFRTDGADVIDLGCLPDTPFPHLEEAIVALRAAGHRVSVDSLAPEDLVRGQRAGADFLLSLTEETLWIADEGDAVPVLIPAVPGDMGSLFRAAEALAARGRRFVADPVLDPIHHGFTASLLRYHQLRQRMPEAEILMGIGNVTELTEADTPGINAMLMGVISELGIQHVLAVQVSPHCRRVIREFDAARRQFLAAREMGSTPKGVGAGLLCLRDRKPFPVPDAQVEETASMVRDRNYRIEVGPAGIHVYNRDGHRLATDPFEIFRGLDLAGDVGHAFYLGVETARAEIAWHLGKRYAQDSGLRWGVAVDAAEEDLSRFHAVGTTKARDPAKCP